MKTNAASLKRDAMNGENSAARDELVAIARIVKPRGVRGEVVADVLTDFPERFERHEDFIAVKPNGERAQVEVENFWFHGERVVLKFKNYDSPESAHELIGIELCVPESECVELEDGEFYDWQLIGCRVETIDNLHVGTVREVLHTGAAPILIIENAGREHLVPLVEKICVRVDPAHKLICVDAPEGMLEI